MSIQLFMRIDDMDFENDIDLIDNRSEYRVPVNVNEPVEKVCESADRILGNPRSSDKLLMDQLIKENKMKEQAVEKASHLIDLLTAELDVKKKILEESQQTISQLKSETGHKLEEWRTEENRLMEKIRSLEKRNNFLEGELKRRVDSGPTGPERKQLKPKSSLRSILRQSHSEERRVQSSRVIKYVRESPKRLRQEEPPQQKPLSIENAYLRKVLSQILSEEGAKMRGAQQILQQQEEYLSEYLQSLNVNKSEVKDLTDQADLETVKLLRQCQLANEQMSSIVREQQGIITALRAQDQDLKNCLQQFLDLLTKNQIFGPLQLPNIAELDKLLAIMTRTIRDRFSKKKREADELKGLKAASGELSKISRLYSQVKYYVGLKDNVQHPQLLARLEALKIQIKTLQDENSELRSIVQGLIKYAKK